MSKLNTSKKKPFFFFQATAFWNSDAEQRSSVLDKLRWPDGTAKEADEEGDYQNLDQEVGQIDIEEEEDP